MFEEYIDFYEKYKNIYGPRTCVLYQNGDFYEMCGVSNANEQLGNVAEIAELLNIKLTRKDSKKIENDRSNWLLAGFQVDSYDFFVQKLIEKHGYVVVTVSQLEEEEESDKKKRKKRGVTNITSPSTYVNGNDFKNNFLICLYIQKLKSKTIINASGIDLSTYQNFVKILTNNDTDNNKSFDDTYALIRSINPKELLIHVENAPEYTETFLRKYLDISNGVRLWYRLDKIPVDFHKLSYQELFLGKVFNKNRGILSPIEYIGLERYPNLVLSYLLLLNFCYQQNENYLNHILPPEFKTDNEHLVLDSNTVMQLDIYNESREQTGSLYNVLNHAKTAMGKRMFFERLLNPIRDCEQLEERYDMVSAFAAMLPTNSRLFDFLKEYLEHTCDIERLQRRLEINTINPDDFTVLNKSYVKIAALIYNLEFVVKLYPHQLACISRILPSGLYDRVQSFITFYNSALNLEEASKNKRIKSNFFNKGFSHDIDNLENKIQLCSQFFNQVKDRIERIIGPNKENTVEIERSEKDGYYLRITNARYKTFLQNCKFPLNVSYGNSQVQIDPKKFDINYNKKKTICLIRTAEMEEISDQWVGLMAVQKDMITKVYDSFVKTIRQTYTETMKMTAKTVATIDMYQSCAKSSVIYRYCRPTIKTTDHSYMIAQKLRHPIVERYDNLGTSYVAQDIDMSDTRGILLFGVNCSGKSVLMKSLGLSIAMAQAGMFVAADSFVFSPYHNLLTRILGNDNMSKGMSSFAVEMSELKSLLTRANKNSLVLGDELSHGTEIISGISLVASSIIKLSSVNTNFLFATHMHPLSDMKRILDIKSLKMFHLKFRLITDNIIYERTLEPGPGLTNYGIMIAKAMGIDRHVIEQAEEIRRDLMEMDQYVVKLRPSHFNRDVYLDRCGLPECDQMAEEVHHIKFQSEADSDGYIGSIHKNNRSNLVPLCESHHRMIHSDKLIIRGYKLTTNNGLQLDYHII
jgi:DNA mismatch repair protein MutS